MSTVLATLGLALLNGIIAVAALVTDSSVTVIAWLQLTLTIVLLDVAFIRWRRRPRTRPRQGHGREHGGVGSEPCQGSLPRGR